MPKMTSILNGRSLIGGAAEGELLFSDVGLSFWGGVNPSSGEIIDRHHPLSGNHLAGRILAIPSGRGSCTGSSVMMELISTGNAPSALVLAEVDEILTLGVLLAEMIFERSLPVICIGKEAFARLRDVAFVRVEGSTVQLREAFPSTTSVVEVAHPGAASADIAVVLTDRDRAMLAGEHGKATQVAMQVVLQMAELQGARSLIDVTQAHIDGCIYTGPSSLRFAEQLVEWGAQVSVPTTLNSISVDQRRWRELGVDPSFGEPASALGEAYMAMGAQMSYTCAPYLLDTAPKAGEQIVWAESNAVVFANSVLAARTLKYPDYLDICIAICGRAPLSGCHLEENRKAQLRIEVKGAGEVDDAFYPLLGYRIGALSGKQIPLILGLENKKPNLDDLKAFAAAFGTTSAAPLFHIAGVTPEAMDPQHAVAAGEDLPALTVEPIDLVASWRELNSAQNSTVDVVSLGNPHFSLSEFSRLAELCRGRSKHPNLAFVITCGRAVLEQARTAGYIAPVEAFGASIVTDTCWCMLGEPVIPPSAKVLMTNSAKYAHYAPGLVGRSVHFASLADCVEAGTKGFASRELPAWLSSVG
ncbi:cis-3-hydroxy-L-proline dehydratase [Pseudomonas sp. NCHU5208]|uniref:cis-3-hydroxy-L-proline dehydratase n=1 Tax=unclassified Pseudomonas TaxID=196821 RepID=UPI003F996B58